MPPSPELGPQQVPGKYIPVGYLVCLRRLSNDRFSNLYIIRLAPSECKKTFQRPALLPGPRWGAYSAPPGPLTGWWGGDWLLLPEEPHSHSRVCIMYALIASMFVQLVVTSMQQVLGVRVTLDLPQHNEVNVYLRYVLQ